jgi:6,7-dimethyl-8-ribityllumazine synthase
VRTLEGNITGQGLKFGIIVSRFNELITGKLLEGALDALRRHGAVEGNISVVWVPGSLEIPATAKRVAKQGEYDAIICLGAIIKGGTSHYELVAGQCAKGIAQVGLEVETPIIFGVVTAETLEQAIERAGTKAGNRGADAAMTAMEMANLYRQFS